jgi:hypothetical protein
MTRIWDKALFPMKKQISELTFRILRGASRHSLLAVYYRLARAG